MSSLNRCPITRTYLLEPVENDLVVRKYNKLGLGLLRRGQFVDDPLRRRPHLEIRAQEYDIKAEGAVAA